MVKKTKKKNNSENHEETFRKGLKWFLILAIVFALGYFLMPKIITEIRTVEYGNITFTKTHFGDIPVFYYWYNFDDDKGNINRYNMYLRLDPRKNDVPVTGEIEFPTIGKTLYVTVKEDGVTECSNANREYTTLVLFLQGNKFTVKAGYFGNETFVNSTATYIDCEKKPRNMVLEIEKTNRTIIQKVDQYCYRLEFQNCEDFLNVVEKFEVQSVIDAKNRSLHQQ